jgi:cysteine desulfurase
VRPVYLDYAASTPVRDEVREAMLPFMSERYGNPSSLHSWGREARAALEGARSRLASALGAAPGEIVFTRGGTEADNLAVLGRARLQPRAPVVCSEIEHRAVLAAAAAAEAEGAPRSLLPVDATGVVRRDTLPELLARSASVVSVMWVNNEIGTVQPIREIAEACVEAGVAFHSDAIQAFGKVSVRVDEVPVSMLSLSAHKIYGPKGTGALFVRKGTRLAPLVHGGGHERGMRSGTEDVAGAVGFALAAELAVAELEREATRLSGLRDRLEAELRRVVPGLVVNGEGAPRAPHVLNVSVPGASGETMLLTMDMEGLAVSSGSACSSGAVTPSHVLTALGLPVEVSGPSVRFSFGKGTTDADIDRVLSVFPRLMERSRTLSAAT